LSVAFAIFGIEPEDFRHVEAKIRTIHDKTELWLRSKIINNGVSKNLLLKILETPGTFYITAEKGGWIVVHAFIPTSEQ